jgi:hypothetical protein
MNTADRSPQQIGITGLDGLDGKDGTLPDTGGDRP